MPLPKSEIIRRAQIYLRAPDAGFWRWSDNGEAAIWNNGATIAFHKELAEVIVPLVDRGGLPPLGSILLLIAATRDSWRDLDTSGMAPLLPKEILATILSLSETDLEIFDSVMSGLNVVQGLDHDVRMSVEAKQTLASLVFEDFHQNLTEFEVSLEVLRLLNGPPEEIYILPTQNIHPATFMNLTGSMTLRSDLRALRHGLTRVSSSTLRMLRETSLEELVIPTAELIPPDHPSTMVRQLLRELDQDVEYCGIARAARQLMSVVTLPRPLQEPDELPQGGVSDITNRGPLDRLLLSELANDDLTLAVRVAVGEAMYLRRETPPRQTTRQRMVVLDCGLRMWGIPRSVATALALAIVAGTDESIELENFASQEFGLQETDLTTRDGIVSHLKRLEPDLHVGRSLSHLREKCELFEQAESSSDSSAIDRILITSNQAIDDPEFILFLDNADVYPIHIATVDREGQVCLFEFSSKGRRELRRAKVDVNEIVRGKPVIDKRVATDLPAIFSVKPFPLRMPNASGLKRAWMVHTPELGSQQSVLAITSDHQLSWWQSPVKGGQLICDSVPPRKLHWSSPNSINGAWYAIVGDGKQDGMTLLKIDLDDGTVTKTTLSIPQDPAGFTFHIDSLFVIYTVHVDVVKRVSKVDLESGLMGKPIPLPKSFSSFLKWDRDRFFRDQVKEGDWFALSTSELGARFEAIPNPHDLAFSTFFECDGIEGPIGITVSGQQFRTGSGGIVFKDHYLLRPMAGTAKVIKVSGEGQVLLENKNPRKPVSAPTQVLINSQDETITPVRAPIYNLETRQLRTIVRETSIQHRFQSISILDEDEAHQRMRHSQARRSTGKTVVSSGLVLSLASRGMARNDLLSDPKFGLHLQSIGPHLQRDSTTNLRCKMEFKEIARPPGTGYRLKQATWDDGSCAVLDSRGFLHLKSSNTQIPELSIVISAGTVWRSDGSVSGNSYFYDDNATIISSAEVHQAMQDFLQHLKLVL